MDTNEALREHLIRALGWGEAHGGFDGAVEGIPPEHYGTQPEGLPYSAWQLVEHLRIAQRDLFDFCRDRAYTAPKWPDDYWPKTSAPPTDVAWAESLAAFRADREALRQFVRDPAVDLFADIPGWPGKTYLRTILLVVDHNAYHVGEFAILRQVMNLWPKKRNR